MISSKVLKSLLKWPMTVKENEQPLTTGLLNDMALEVELSEYQRLQADDEENPSDLLSGERSNVGPISDLDHFFQNLYNYYCEKGFWCIVARWIVELLSLAFVILFSFIFLLYVDWHALRTVDCGGGCDLDNIAFHKNPFRPFTFFTGVVVVYLGILSIYWVFCFIRFFAQLKDTLEIRDFYWNSLKITDVEMRTLSWSTILDKTVEFQSVQRLCVVKDLSVHDIVMRIMRRDNYLIGMLNKGVLAIPIRKWVPGTGPPVHSTNGPKRYMMLTKTLEWSLNWCILQDMFDRNFSLRRDFITNPELLRKRLKTVGVGMILLAPFVIIFMLVYFFLRHAEHFYKHPSTVASRRWSNLSRWLFREFNELDHLFRQRLNAGVKHANEYLEQFPSPYVTLIAKLVSFVAGGFAAVFLIIALIAESLLEANLFGRTLFWHGAIFAAISAISRAVIPDEFQVFDPKATMSLVSQQTHYMPKSWRGAETSANVRKEFEALFQYTGSMLLEEMVSIFVTPYVLFFLLPQQADDILQFIAQFTVTVEGVGDVCSLSVFDFQRHGNGKYGSPYYSSKQDRSCQGKMEKSFLSFKNNYPNWEPSPEGKQMLSTLVDFHQQEQEKLETERQLQRTVRMRDFSSDFLSNSREGFSRGFPSPRPSVGFQQMGNYEVTQTTISQQMDHAYLLDQYYMSQSLQGLDTASNQPDLSALHRDLLLHEEIPVPTHYDGRMQPENQQGDNKSSMSERLGSHMEASTSDAMFQEHEIQHGIFGSEGHLNQHRWWARNGAPINTDGSFIEPQICYESSHFNGETGQSANDGYNDDEETMENKGSSLQRGEGSINQSGHTSYYSPGDKLRDTMLAMRQSTGSFSGSFMHDSYTDFELPFGDVYDDPMQQLNESYLHDRTQNESAE